MLKQYRLLFILFICHEALAWVVPNQNIPNNFNSIPNSNSNASNTQNNSNKPTTNNNPVQADPITIDDWKNQLGKGDNTQQIQKPLTDSEVVTSREYIHEGLHKRLYDNFCGKDATGKVVDEDAAKVCSGEKGKTIPFENADMIVETMAKMYGLFGIMSSFNMTSLANSASQMQTQMDYCGMIAMGNEMLAMFQQQTHNQTIQNTVSPPGAEQRDALEKVLRVHEGRVKTAMIQAIGWSAISGCYIFQMVQTGWKTGLTELASENKLMILKTAAAAGFTAYFWIAYDKSKNRAEIIEAALKKWPKPGDCNPLTYPNCYCTQPETKNDPQYCLGKLFAERKGQANEIVSCVNNKLNMDPNCSCLSNNTCADTIMKDFAAQNINYQKLMEQGAMKNVEKMMRGDIGFGQITGNQSNISQAIKEITPDLENALGDPPEVNDKNKGAFDFFKSAGLSPILAAHLTGLPKDKNIDGLIRDLKQSSDGDINPLGLISKNAIGNSFPNDNIHYFESPQARANRGYASNGDGQDAMLNQFMQQMKKGKKVENQNVHMFMDKALEKASIEQRSQVSIFTAISVRYQKKLSSGDLVSKP